MNRYCYSWVCWFSYIVISNSILLANFKEESISHYIPEVVKKHPKDPSFTQGLTIKDGILYESIGRYGGSKLRLLDLETFKVIRQIDLDPHYFAEGIAIKGNRLFQLTWNEQSAFIYQLYPLKRIQKVPFKGQGWGLCVDGDNLVATNGTSEVSWLDPFNLNPIKKIKVILKDKPVQRLNDLECVGDVLYLNVWMTDYILIVNKYLGRVMGVVDASSLLSENERRKLPIEATLNGITYRQSSHTFFLTGKYWPYFFEVRFKKQ